MQLARDVRLILIKNFNGIDKISKDAKKITGEVSKEAILEVLDEVWM